jgi:hypothetical protein
VTIGDSFLSLAKIRGSLLSAMLQGIVARLLGHSHHDLENDDYLALVAGLMDSCDEAHA